MVWNTDIELGDLFKLYRGQPTNEIPIEEFEPFRDAVVARIREAEFYSDNDNVLRGLVNDLAAAHDPEQFNKEWNYLAMWGDQEHIRVRFLVY